MIVKSLVAKLRIRYDVSASEIDEQDKDQIIVIGVSTNVPHTAFDDSLMEDISLFVEKNMEAELIDEEREIIYVITKHEKFFYVPIHPL